MLDTLSEATTLGFDVQLRILQALPSLFHNYGQDVQGPLLAKALTICSTLQGSKTAAVNSTAAATLQQLIVCVFDKVVAEDGAVFRSRSVLYVTNRSLAEAEGEAKATEAIPLEDGDVSVPLATADAYRVRSHTRKLRSLPE